MKEKEVLGGFSAVFDSISTNTSGKGYKDFSEEEETVTIEQEEDDDDIVDLVDTDDTKETAQEEQKEVDAVKTVDTKEDDSNQISLLFQAIAEGVGVEVKDDELPKTADELLGYINAIVDDKSKPSYASDEVKEIFHLMKELVSDNYQR